ncbi:hypothetical protein DH2020_018391 [Rehmannia glutinosa]|uniref:Protein kinase domain-containing protein n=1 Tax=Rehmannia glutinosa TaxID=99300 RepID=A0ABR0WM80_REHGL
MARKPTVLPRAIVLTLTVLLQYYAAIPSLAESEAEILLKFKESLENTGALSDWSNAKPPCNGDQENWVGIFCENGTVWGIQLQNMGLEGIIDVDALTKLVYLRTISFMGNNFDGPLPNLTRLSALKSIYLSNNKFSGDIPANVFSGMLSLKKLHLANNKFSGQIPEALAALPRLKELMLENNDFVGEIPKFPQDRIKSINVSHNELVGEIPVSLSKFSASAFEGNRYLCGAPLRSCDAPEQPSVGTIIIVAIVVTAAIAALVVVVIILRRRKQIPDQPLAAGAAGRAGDAGSKQNGTRPAIWLRYMNNVNKEEFHEHMRRLGRLSHPNVLPVVGFYYRKEEKLLVTDYVEKVSLAVQLHGNRSKSRPCPDWPTRLRIVKGVARGLLYLYNELPSLTAPHGHLKSSNVLLDGSYTPLLTDYGLVPVQGNGGDTADIASWVESAVRGGDSSVEIFDADMVRSERSEGEMMKLLKLGLNCCETDVELRPDMKDAVEKIEEVQEEE